jgi:hypothetical protein
MKIRLITNTDGFVLGSAPRRVTPSGDGAPARAEPIPLQGQMIVEVDISKELSALTPSDLQRQYRFDRRRKALVKFQPRPAKAQAQTASEASPAGKGPASRTKRK